MRLLWITCPLSHFLQRVSTFHAHFCSVTSEQGAVHLIKEKLEECNCRLNWVFEFCLSSVHLGTMPRLYVSLCVCLREHQVSGFLRCSNRHKDRHTQICSQIKSADCTDFTFTTKQEQVSIKNKSIMTSVINTRHFRGKHTSGASGLYSFSIFNFSVFIMKGG